MISAGPPGARSRRCHAGRARTVAASRRRPYQSLSQVMISAGAEHCFAQQATDVTGELLIQTRAGARVRLEDAVEVRAKENAERTVRRSPRLRGAWRAVDQGKIAEEVARSELGERCIG